MDAQTPRPPTTVRRNPPRRARHTPFPPTSPPTTTATSSAADLGITPFPLHHLLHPDPPPSPAKPTAAAAADASSSESLKVFLRVRPVDVRARAARAGGTARTRGKAASPKRGKSRSSNMCLVVNGSSSVTLSAPPSKNDSKRAKTEVYDGFSFVFPPQSSQKEVYDRIMNPLVMDFMGGKSALLAAMGPTGSGKTHTMFGCPRDPGMVPLAFHQIFGHSSDSDDAQSSRSYYLSMFEINSERGKGEKILDLSPMGGDLSLQQSSVKGLQEIMVSSVTEAESVVARGMLKRSTAMTNANDQSSRSQCIINIRSALNGTNHEDQLLQNNAILTIADLAGAERERKTGNQGVRLLESSFINNTSMVLGQCLRSLLEHQKNPKKPLQKHYKNSMLTRYLKEYLEGKKRMTLILTVKPGGDDYLDTSFLLRQASPYMKIKFSIVEEFSNAPYPKRSATSIRIETTKRRKFNNTDADLIDGGQDDKEAVAGLEISEKEDHSERMQIFRMPENSNISSGRLNTEHTGKPLNENHDVEWKRMVRNEEVMRNFAKALWNVLKEYKQKLEVSENQVQSLEETLKKETVQVAELEKELKDLKSHCLCHKQPSPQESYSPEGDLLLNYSDTVALISSPSQSTLENVDVTLCQISESSPITRSDPEVMDLVPKGIFVDSDQTGDNNSTISSLEEPQESMPLLEEEKLKSPMRGSLSGEECVSKNLEVLNDFVIPVISSNVNSRDSNFFISSVEIKDRTRLYPSVEQLDPVIKDEKLETSNPAESVTSPEDRKKQNHENCICFRRDNDSKDIKDLNSAGFGEVMTNVTLTGSTDSDHVVRSLQSCTKLQDAESVLSSPVVHKMLVEEKLLTLKAMEQLMDQKRESSQETKYNCELEELKDSQGSLQSTCLTEMHSDSLMYPSYSGDQVVNDKSRFSLLEKHGTSFMEDEELAKSHLPLAELVGQNDECRVRRHTKKEHDSSSKALNAVKSRRRLLPASAMLLKEFSGLNMEAGNPKENRVKTTAEGRGRSQGSISLVRLLKSNFQQ